MFITQFTKTHANNCVEIQWQERHFGPNCSLLWTVILLDARECSYHEEPKYLLRNPKPFDVGEDFVRFAARRLDGIVLESY